MVDFQFETTCYFQNNAIHCSVVTDLGDVEFAYYIEINGASKEVLYYPQPNKITFSTEIMKLWIFLKRLFLLEIMGEKFFQKARKRERLGVYVMPHFLQH